ncbi:MAG: hypothetical protein SFU98_01425 [Leptospiraceae bacterium]|nr:hypothetical protein [Leptospiraceae bacterium]
MSLVKNALKSILIFSLVYCSVPSRVLYNNNFFLKSIYTKPNLSANSNYIPYGSKIKVINESVLSNGVSFFKVAIGNDEGYVTPNLLEENKLKYYFISSDIDKIFLRTEPKINSKSLALLNTKTVGEIIQCEDSFSITQYQIGFWCKAIVENKIGWVFSSNIFIYSEKEKELVNEFKFFELKGNEFYIEKLNPIEVKENEFKKSKKVFTKGNYEIYQLDYKSEEGTCCGIQTQHDFFIYNMITKKYYKSFMYFRDVVYYFIYPEFNNSISLYYNSGCCDSLGEHMFLYLDSNQPLVIRNFGLSSKGECHIYSFQFDNQSQFDKLSNSILMKRDFADCNGQDYILNKRSLYSRIRFEGADILFERYNSKSLPKEFQLVWEKSKKLKGNLILSYK